MLACQRTPTHHLLKSEGEGAVHIQCTPLPLCLRRNWHSIQSTHSMHLPSWLSSVSGGHNG